MWGLRKAAVCLSLLGLTGTGDFGIILLYSARAQTLSDNDNVVDVQ